MNWRDIPSLAALRAFEAAARHQSFTKAAAELNVTQAGIAQHVRNLEADLGEPLVVKQGRGIEITGAGANLAAALRDGFSIIADGVADIRALSQDRALSISTTPAFATHWLMPRIGDFWAKFPEITVSLTTGLAVVDLRRDRYDLAIRFGLGTWSGLEVERLTDGNFWVIANPKLLKGSKPTCVQDVVHLPWLLETEMEERRILLEEEGVDFSDLSVSFMHTNSLVIAGVKAGLCVSIQPKTLVERDVQNGELVKICELNHPNLGYYMVQVKDRNPNGLRQLKGWLRKQGAL